MELKQSAINIKGLNRDDSQIIPNNDFALENLNIRIDVSKESSGLSKINDTGNSVVVNSQSANIEGVIIGCHNVDDDLIIFTTENSDWHLQGLQFQLNNIKFHDIVSSGFSLSLEAYEGYENLDWNNIKVEVKVTSIVKTINGYTFLEQNKPYFGTRVYDSNVPNKYFFYLDTIDDNTHAILVEKISLYYSYYSSTDEKFVDKLIHSNSNITLCKTQEDIHGYKITEASNLFPTYIINNSYLYNNTTLYTNEGPSQPTVTVLGGTAEPAGNWWGIIPDMYHISSYKCYVMLKQVDDSYNIIQEVPEFPTSEVTPGNCYLVIYDYNIISKKDYVPTNINIATTASKVQGNTFAITANPVPATENVNLKLEDSNDFVVKQAYKIGGISTWIIEATTDINFYATISYDQISVQQYVTVSLPNLTCSYNGSTGIVENINLNQDTQDFQLVIVSNTDYEVTITYFNDDTFITPEIPCDGIIHSGNKGITFNIPALPTGTNFRSAVIRIDSRNEFLDKTYYYNIIQTI